MLYYFTADGRVDFRELVKDLASHFHTRIELRQIGVRDEAKAIGGIGPCGRKALLFDVLRRFYPCLDQNGQKIRAVFESDENFPGCVVVLMCCLKYENDEYEQAKRELPDRGKEVETPDGKGKSSRSGFIAAHYQSPFVRSTNAHRL